MEKRMADIGFRFGKQEFATQEKYPVGVCLMASLVMRDEAFRRHVQVEMGDTSG